jgi:predicted ferric reductase
MHAILFQMALIPMTMSRFSFAALSESFIDKIVPLNQALRMHIHLGYTMITILFLATGFFFAFFGVLCADGDQLFCDKFKSEIMITGYVILSMLLIIGGTSYFRHKIPYELFYGIHHLVFIMYFITIAHTLDVQQRTGMKERSQTFKWFSSTLLFYFCDRAAMHLNHKYQTRLLGSSVVTGSTGSKMVILKLSRPVLFRFKPGQYAFLRVNEIDNSWHPFAIASYPDSSQLEFYIEVYEGKAWTKKLWDLLEANNEKGAASSLQLTVEVMGPYGTSLAKTEDYSHILAVGAGTGMSIVTTESSNVLKPNLTI